MISLKQFASLEFPLTLRLLGLLLLGLLGLWVMLPWGDRAVGIPDLRKRKAWLGLLLFLPLGILWMVSFYKPLYAPGRYDLVSFPAYPLLLGLALCKTQRVARAGPIVAPIVALLLLLPIGSKLFGYYHAPSPGDAQATARLLHARMPEGDVVVFTGLRGNRFLYYLSRLGYRWEAGECRNAQTGRRFGCRMYPRETEQTPGVLDARRILASPEAVRADVQDFLRALPAQGGALWVVFLSGSLSQGRLVLPESDSRLVGELQRLGLEFSPVELSLGIFRFRRPLTAPSTP